MTNSLTPFERALTDAVLDNFADVPVMDGAVELVPSPAFSHRMERRVRFEETRPVLRRLVGWLLLVAAMLAVFARLHTAASPRPVVQTPYTIICFGDYYRFYFTRTGEAPKTEYMETVFEPTYIPRGYKLQTDEAVTNFGFVCRHWKNAAGDHIFYDQFPIGDSICAAPYWYTTQDALRRIEVNGYQVWRSWDEDWIFYFWTDDAYYYLLDVSDTRSAETAERILASIRENPNAEIWWP